MEKHEDPKYCAGCDTAPTSEWRHSLISLSEDYEEERLHALDRWVKDNRPTVGGAGLCVDCAQIRKYSPGPHGERLRKDFPG